VKNCGGEEAYTGFRGRFEARLSIFLESKMNKKSNRGTAPVRSESFSASAHTIIVIKNELLAELVKV
jgi:hypothetical protein